MVIYDSPIMTISANEATPTSFIKIGKGEHRVDIAFSSGGSGTVTPKQTTDPNNSSALEACTINDTEIVTTGTKSFIIAGPVFLGCIVSGLSGSVKVTANKLD